MALPGGAVAHTITFGAYADPSFAGMKGILRLSHPMTHIATGDVVQQTWTFVIGNDGTASLAGLPANDDPAFAPTGTSYSLEWQVLAWKDSPGNKTFIVPLAGPTTVDFDLLASVDGTQSGTYALPLVTSVNGHAGAVTLAASDVGADAAGAATAAQAAALAGSTPLQRINAAAVTTAGALAVNKHNPVDATAGPLTMTLPTGQIEGTQIVVEKTDATTNAVTVSGSLRGVGAQTVVLVWQRETVMLRADSSGSWWPIAGHKTKSSLDAAYAGQVTDAAVAGAWGASTGAKAAADPALRAAFDAAGAAAAAQTAAQSYAAGAAAGMALVFGA